MSKAKVLQVLNAPRAVVFSNSADLAGKIKKVFEEAYMIPTAGIQVNTLDLLEARMTAILNKYSTLELIVIDLQGFKNPNEPIKIIKHHNLGIIALAPIRKNGHSRLTDLPESRAVVIQMQHKDWLNKAGMTTRRMLGITEEINEKALPKQEPSGGGISRRPLAGGAGGFESENDGNWLTEGSDFSENSGPRFLSDELDKKPPTPSKQVDKPVHHQTPDQSPKKLGNKEQVIRVNGKSHPAIAPMVEPVIHAPVVPSRTNWLRTVPPPVQAEEPGREDSLSTTEMPGTAVLCDALAEATRQLAETSRFLESLRRSIEAAHGKPIEKPAEVLKNALAEKNDVKQPFEQIVLSMKLSEGPKRVLIKLLEEPTALVSKDVLIDGSSPGAFNQYIFAIRKRLEAIYGKDGPNALINHKGRGYSIHPAILLKQ